MWAREADKGANMLEFNAKTTLGHRVSVPNSELALQLLNHY